MIRCTGKSGVGVAVLAKGLSVSIGDGARLENLKDSTFLGVRRGVVQMLKLGEKGEDGGIVSIQSAADLFFAGTRGGFERKAGSARHSE